MSRRNRSDQQSESPVQPKVLHVTPEMVPLVKVGGLGDVVGSLPGSLNAIDTDARVLLPAYAGVMDRISDAGFRLTHLTRSVEAALRWKVYRARIWRALVNGIPVYLLENDALFGSPSPYPDVLTPESVLPFAFLSLASLDIHTAIRWKPDVIHCHDWPASLTAIALRWHRHYRTVSHRPATVLTIHNLAHQGLLPASVLDEWGIADDAFAMQGVEYYGNVNLLKGSIVASDRITTVSPRYASEILTEKGGCGLAGILRENADKLSGILNGLDTNLWNPERDRLLSSSFSTKKPEGKKTCRRAFLEDIGWDDDGAPLCVMVSRLVRQKGLDILIPAIPDILALGARVVIIGKGEPAFEERLSSMDAEFPGRFRALLTYDERLAHSAYAGGDIFLMPSDFEPCGLSQLISLRYGSVPVVRAVGGLADTIRDADASPDGYGFTFDDYETEALTSAVSRALDAFRDAERWDGIRTRGMKKNFGWEQSASAYKDLYLSLLSKA